MIVTAGGKNVYPEDIENAFVDLPGVEEHCVLAKNFVWSTGKLKDEQLLLVLRPKAGVEVDDAFLERVRTFNSKLAEYKRVHGIVRVENELPRTASQKIKREALADVLKSTMKPEQAVISL
jgi:long-chain acyl-CoA synthetase